MGGLAGRLGLGKLGERRLLRFGFGWYLCLILVCTEIVDNFRDGIADAQHLFVADQSPVRIGLREFEAFEEHLVVVGDKWFFLEDGFGLFGGLDRVTRQHALIDQLCRRQGRLVAEHHVEKFEAVDVAAEHDEADVKGIARTRPIGPHSQVQNVAAAITATGESRCYGRTAAVRRHARQWFHNNEQGGGP